MAIKAILFDLDGTLLPMDQDVFIKAYFGGIAAKLVPYGFEPKTLIGGIYKGTDAMINNDGSVTNEEAFWNTFCKIFGEKARQYEPIFEDFYKNEFDDVKRVSTSSPIAKDIVDSLKARGIRVILATSPVFPRIATESRIAWAGLEPSDFEYISTYENSRYTKPNTKYYEEILEKTGLSPDECIMVGNDVSDDMIAETLGMRVFLLTDFLVNRENLDISHYDRGGFTELSVFLDNINN